MYLQFNSPTFADFLISENVSQLPKATPSSRVPLREVRRRQNKQNDNVNQVQAIGLAKKKTVATPTNDAKIYQLNDDCLKKIFDYLNAKDLLSIAIVLPIFAKIAQIPFSIKHQSINLETLGLANILQFQHFISTFGRKIVSLEVALPQLLQTTDEAFRFEHEIQALIVRYCGGTLTELKMAHFKLKQVEMWRPLFAGLRKLHLHRCRFTDQFVQMLECCVELEQIDWNTSTIDIDWSLCIPLPKLKIFRVNEVAGISMDVLATFLLLNPQLKEVSVTKCAGIDGSILEEIAKEVPQIENISYISSTSQYVAHFSGVKRLNGLKTLKIDFQNNAEASNLFSQLIGKGLRLAKGLRLEHLNLAKCVLSDQLLTRLTQMRTLKSLGLFAVNGMDIGQLLYVVKNLENLTHLHFVECKGLNTEGLVDIVRVGKKLRQLQFHTPMQKVDINNVTCRLLRSLVQRRAKKIPLEILAVGMVNDKSVQDTVMASSDEDSLSIRFVESSDLCGRYQADDLFLFNFYYDHHFRIKHIRG